jgi:peptidoglycan L-alanyl-D-glutamate endopeptidase CwlK
MGIFENGKYYTGANKKEDAAYVECATLAKQSVRGLEWGGDWKTFKDMPHYQLATGKSVAQVRVAFEKGTDFTVA